MVRIFFVMYFADSFIAQALKEFFNLQKIAFL